MFLNPGIPVIEDDGCLARKNGQVHCHWLFSTKTAARLAKSVERLTNEQKVGLILGVVPTLRI